LKLELSVKNHFLSDDYIPTFKKYDVVRTIDITDDSGIEELYYIINSYVHTYYKYKNNLRNEKSFESASALLLDFDNKGHHNDSTISEFVSSDFAQKYNWILYTSKSHIPNIQECYHVIVPLDEYITSINSLANTYNKLFSELDDEGIVCDTQVRDGARLIFPSMNMDDSENHFDTFVFEYNVSSKCYSIAPETTIDDNIPNVSYDLIYETIGTEDYPDDGVNFYIDEFRKMSKSAKYAYMKRIMTHLNMKNRRSGFSFIQYKRWVAIGYSLYNIFGTVKGLRLFRVLSYGHPNDTQDSIDKQYENLCYTNFDVVDSLGVLFSISSRSRFNHIMYLKFYYMNKHRMGRYEKYSLYITMVRKLLIMYGYEHIDMSKVKLYNYTFKSKSRTFLMVISDDDNDIHIKVNLSDMIDIMAKLLSVDRRLITTSITRGVIRKYININGVYDVVNHIKKRILDILNDNESDIIRVSEINDIVYNTRTYTPSTIQGLTTNKNIELYMFELGIFIEKKKFRFKKYDNRAYMGYIVDKNQIRITSDKILLESYKYVVKKKEIGYIIPKTSVCSRINNVVMKC